MLLFTRAQLCFAVAVMAAARLLSAVPSRVTLEAHVDRNVEVYGKYAAIKLPINKGVPLWNPGAIRTSPDGRIFVANYVGEIYQIADTDGDGLEDRAILFCNVKEQGLRAPTSIAFYGRELFVGTAQEIRAYEDLDNDGKADRNRTVLKVPFSADPQDWTFGLCFGPDGFLYAILSTDSYNPNPAPDPNGWRGSILRLSPDGSQVERFATGVRFAPGMAFHPNGNLFFSDNEGGGNPTEELNLAAKGKFFGHNPTKFSPTEPGVPPIARLSSARGVCGIAFNLATNRFDGAADELFVALWGIGGMPNDGAVARVRLWEDSTGAMRARETPFARIPKAYDLAFGPSGDLYVTAHGNTPAAMTPNPTPTGSIYRIVPAPWITGSGLQPAAVPQLRGNPERGKALFAERACAQCHAMDGATELLGPNLAHLGALMDFKAAYEAISKPSRSIRSGYETEIFEMADGETVTGRIITSNAKQVVLMVPGNTTVTIERADIRKNHASPTSLMPENLLDGLDRKSLHDLFAYMEVREQLFIIRWRYRLIGGAIAGFVLLATSLSLAVALRGGRPNSGKPK